MRRKLLDDDIDFEDDFDDEYGGVKTYDTVVKKCHCGFKGELIPDPNGLSCQSCGYVLIERRY